MSSLRRLNWVLSGCVAVLSNGWHAPLRAEDPAMHAYFAERIWTGEGPPIANAVLLVRNGAVAAVGARGEVAVPADAIRHDWPGKVLIPGLVVAETSLGAAASDDENALTPQVRAVDGFDFFGDYSSLLAGGVTTVQISPGRQRLMPGQGAVVKLAGQGRSRRLLAAEESLRILLTEASRNPPRIYEPPVGAVSVDNPFEQTRPQLSTSLAGAAAGLRALLRTARIASTEQREDDPRLEVIAAYSARRRRLRITASQAAEIQAALALSTEFSLPLILVDPKQLDPFLDRLRATDLVGVILNADVRPGRVGEPPIPDRRRPADRRPWEYARELSDRGLADLIALRPADDDDLNQMLFLAGLFTRSGNEPAQVLRMVTSNPARILGVASRVGSLLSGRDADFVVLSNGPFQTDTRVLATYVDGELMFDLQRDQQSLVIQAGGVYSGDKLLRPGSVVVDGSKIRDVGSQVSASPHARLRQFPATAVIAPGMIDLATGLGLGEAPAGSTPLQTKFGERLIADDPAIAVARQGGVTTVVLTAAGSPSPMTAFKLGREPTLLGDPIAVRFSIGSNVADSLAGLKRGLLQGKAYAEAWNTYDEQYKEYEAKLKQYEAELAKYQAAKSAAKAKREDKGGSDDGADTGEPGKPSATDPKDEPKPEEDKPAEKQPDTTPSPQDKPPSPKKPAEKAGDVELKEPTKPVEPKKPAAKEGLEPYRALFAGKSAAFVEVSGIKAIDAAIELFRGEFQFTTILVGDDDLDRRADALAGRQVAAAIGPSLLRRRDNWIINLPQVLANHQVDFGFQSKARTGVRDLPLAVQFAVHRGLGPADALRALTSTPAKMLALESRIGDLAPGKDADLVIWSGLPLEASSEVLAVMIDGQWVYEKGTDP